MSTTNNAAYQVAKGASPFTVKDAGYTKPGEGEVVLKNGAAAVNPVDWKMQDEGIFIKEYPVILGSDLAGTIVEVGPKVEGFKEGDRVLAHAHGLLTGDSTKGAFQEYTVVPTSLMTHLPQSMTFAQGSVLPLCIDTAAAGLYSPGFLELQPPSTSPKPNGKTLLIWSGSSSVGSCAIQLAKASGYEVFTTASKQNQQYVKDLGADKVYDHHDASVVSGIVDGLKGKDVVGAYDAVSTETSLAAVQQILQKAGGTQKVASVLPGTDQHATTAEVKPLFAFQVLWDKVGNMIWREYLPKALAEGKFLAKPDPIVAGKGVDGFQKGVDKAREGVSAAKIVVQL